MQSTKLKDGATSKELPSWFVPADADEKVLAKFGSTHHDHGLFVRLYFAQWVMDENSRNNADHVWTLWLPNKQFRYYPDPAPIDKVWYQAKLHNTELKVFDESNSWNLPEEFLETIYLPHESHPS